MVAPLQKRQPIVRSVYYAIVHAIVVQSDGTITKEDVRVDGRRNSVGAYFEEARRINKRCVPQTISVYKETGIMEVELFVELARRYSRTEVHELSTE